MKKIIALILASLMLFALLVSCKDSGSSQGGSSPAGNSPSVNSPAKKDKFVIAMSQCNLGEPWRVAMNAQIAAAAKKYPQFEMVYSDAQQDNSKQIADVENFITQKVDLLIISPNEAAPLTAVVKKAYDAGIPVIVLDRRVDGDAYTSFIGGDNVLIGKKAGEYVAKNFPNGCKIVELKGLEGATPQEERHRGFVEGLGGDSKYEFVYSQNCDWLRDKAITLMETALQTNDKIDVVYGHNDPAAMGAFLAATNAGRAGGITFIGIDALPNEGIPAVIAGELSVTYVYPTGGEDAIDAAYRLLVEGKTLEKEVILDTLEITPANAQEMLVKFGG